MPENEKPYYGPHVAGPDCPCNPKKTVVINKTSLRHKVKTKLEHRFFEDVLEETPYMTGMEFTNWALENDFKLPEGSEFWIDY